MRVLLVLLALTAPALAQREAVVSAHPLASEAGLSMLRAGGHAIDAAIAAQLMLSVVEPHASGIGGGALLLHWDGARLSHLDGLAAAPARITARLVDDADGTTLPAAAVARSGRAVAVPGAIAMLAMAHARHGALPWEALFAPAIAAAEQGFPMPRYLHQVLRARATALAALPAIRALYFGDDGQPLPVGTLLRNPAQAQSLRLLARLGPAALHQGPLAEQWLAAINAHALPGWTTREDLAAYAPREREALCMTVFERRVCSAAPPSSGGVAVLQMLGLLERWGIARHAPDSAAAAHLVIEASRLATADRRRWVGDPDHVGVPADGLLDRAYLDARAALASPERAMARVAAGDPPRRHGALPADAAPLAEAATSHVSVVDAQGRAVALTTTNNLNFGAELMAGGFALNNAMTNFATEPGSAERPAQNRMRAGARPATTMAPSIVFGPDGQPEIILGAGGGARIVDAVAVALVEMLAWRADAATATARPRIGAATGTEEVERDSPAAALGPALTALGHNPQAAVMNTGLNILRREAAGWTGAADPRRDGQVAAR